MGQKWYQRMGSVGTESFLIAACFFSSPPSLRYIPDKNGFSLGLFERDEILTFWFCWEGLGPRHPTICSNVQTAQQGAVDDLAAAGLRWQHLAPTGLPAGAPSLSCAGHCWTAWGGKAMAGGWSADLVPLRWGHVPWSKLSVWGWYSKGSGASMQSKDASYMSARLFDKWLATQATMDLKHTSRLGSGPHYIILLQLHPTSEQFSYSNLQSQFPFSLVFFQMFRSSPYLPRSNWSWCHRSAICLRSIQCLLVWWPMASPCGRLPNQMCPCSR